MNFKNRLYKVKRFLLLLIVIVVFYSCAWLIRADDAMVWYNQLELPFLMPSEYMYNIALTIISIFTAHSLLLFYDRSPRDSLFWAVIGLFVANGLLAVSWTVVFFVWHRIGLAWWVALALVGTLLALLVLLAKRDRTAALRLVPYTLCVLFVLYLNAQIWMIN